MTDGLRSATIFCLSADLPASIPNPAHIDHLDPATLIGADASRERCFVRKLSAAGATLRLLETNVEDGDRFTLELENGQVIEGEISWIDEDEAGFLFDAPIDVVGALARNLAHLPAERRSVPRVELHQTVSIRRGNKVEFARTRDVSQAGVGIDMEFALAPDEEVQIAFDGLHPIVGQVRWSQGRHAGIAFESELGWQILMPWLRQAQNRPSRIHTIRTLGIHEEEKGFGLKADKAALHLDAPGRVREGARWWNVRVRSLTFGLVEFEADASIEKGTPLWITLPGTTGWPATVIEADQGRYLAEFRIPLRQHELDRIAARDI
jgi:hypothetical protein